MGNKTTRSGFTIVELLIVIVIIAILAAITVTAFSGIRERAENTKTVNAVTAYARGLLLYSQDKGAYPGPGTDTWACLPSPDASCGSSSNTPDPACFGLNNTAMGSFETSMGAYVKALPSTSQQAIQCSHGRTFSGALINVPNGAKAARIFFGQKGSAITCPTVSGTSLAWSTVEVDATLCVIDLPNL